MIRNIIKIDEDKCNGCGKCAEACHEGAIGMVDGVAKLLRDDYCDGLGDCLPACPTGAISFEKREAAAYDEAAVLANMEKQKAKQSSGCPGVAAKTIGHSGCPGSTAKTVKIDNAPPADQKAGRYEVPSRLSQWPIQIKLAPTNAPYYQGAKLLIASDCTAFAYGNFHEDFIKNHITLIGCPKLDAVDYAEKLTEIMQLNDIKSVTVVRMQVPCCGGMEMAVKRALQQSGKMIPWQVVTIGMDGQILDN